MESGHLNVLFRPRRQLFQFDFPPLLNLLKLDMNGRPFSSAVHVPQVNHVALNGDELDEVHIDIRSELLGNQFRNIQCADP